MILGSWRLRAVYRMCKRLQEQSLAKPDRRANCDPGILLMSFIFDKGRSSMLITTSDSLDRYEGCGWMSISRLRNNVNPTTPISPSLTAAPNYEYLLPMTSYAPVNGWSAKSKQKVDLSTPTHTESINPIFRHVRNPPPSAISPQFSRSRLRWYASTPPT